ncbi:MAG: biotin/lipoyl-binding protein, partial [Woeseiaceae bacterium]
MTPEQQQDGSRSGGERTLKIADTSAQDVRLEPRDPRRKRLIIIGIGLAVIVLAVIAAPSIQRWANATVSVPYDRIRTAAVERGDLVRDVTVQGRVVAAVRPTLYATAPGTITLQVEAGEQVSAGQVLGTVDSPELTNRLQQAEASLAQRKLELDRQRIETRQQALELELRVAQRTEEIRQQQERTEAILRSVADAVIVFDLQGRVIMTNPMARLLYDEHDLDMDLGVRVEELVDRALNEAHEVSDASDIIEVGQVTVQA